MHKPEENVTFNWLMCQQNGNSYFNAYKGFLEVFMNTEIFQYSFVSLLSL